MKVVIVCEKHAGIVSDFDLIGLPGDDSAIVGTVPRGVLGLWRVPIAGEAIEVSPSAMSRAVSEARS
jgi:hypothetical protein